MEKLFELGMLHGCLGCSTSCKMGVGGGDKGIDRFLASETKEHTMLKKTFPSRLVTYSNTLQKWGKGQNGNTEEKNRKKNL